ncbi:MAG TPA: sigma-70 family RNA polymerase sigma factor [Terriglobia bacterium]|nr:sigma-70 family RNA polymerase sigma factor [Terriglobia bacterium]
MQKEFNSDDLERAGSPSGEEASFVHRLQANEDAAYDELTRTYTSAIYHVAYRMLGDSAEASDVVQEIFLKVFRNIRSFRGDSSLKTWIYRIAFSEILNRLRWWKRRFRFATISLDDGPDGASPRFYLRHSGPSPHQALETKERETVVQAALKQMSRDHRSILVLRDIEGFSYTEIGDVLGLSAGTVKSRLARARADMKRVLMRPAMAPSVGFARSMEIEEEII